MHGLKEPFFDLENNAGHDGISHNFADRNFVYKNNHLEFLADENPSPLTVSGDTLNSVFLTVSPVIHELPESSGKIVEETFVYSPPGWICATFCYSFKSNRYVTTYDIGYRGLVKLEAQNPYYIRANGAPYHSFDENYYGLPTTLEILKLIAENYFILTDIKLSVNDMSLRKGGLYDVAGDWEPAHESHREGKDVDINKAGADGIRCELDRDFFIATDMLLPPVNNEALNPFGSTERSAVNCESGGRKHIDFEINFDDFIGQGSFY